ncbi:MAG: sulfatase-like hydrolase/transferase [Alphaproteobacteria bacterium]|nr:sulfatase-like hydrolase/transferase [Alphaproteobacteria bacterium]MBU2084827.1 sulfatase-like hydrolase/transferase [Alphaproteobacteria bacterium]MBU2144095.1 sulfatase-like hydrolase/transferase [Alphaproteobacteria bacterium]MBU2198210.1 sulfatase-like hydrolase/transferase [Alphaproteobacteria bacterium]
MLKKLVLGALAIIVMAGGAAFLNKKAIILYVATHTGRTDVATNRAIDWDQGPDVASETAADRPPNIIFILVDDLGINDLSTFGGGVAGGRVPTPNIDKLAADGALFTQAYAGNGTCAPSRAMLMTGRYPTRTGFEFTPTPPGMGKIVSMFANDMDRGALPPVDYNRDGAESAVPFQEMGLPGEEVTIAEVLKDEGYHTVHIGKWHLGRSAESNPNAQGFDESLLMASGLFLPEDDPDVVNAKLDFDPIDTFLWARMQFAASFNSGDWFEPAGYLTDYWTAESLKVIEANKNRPFFLYLAHWGVHTPLQATKADYEAVGDIEPHRLRVYAAMLHALDRSVGEITAKLEEEGLADNTIIVFSSDNGGAGYIGLPEVNAPYRGWKITLFEGGIRVPMFLKWPARIAAGTQVDSPVAHIDVMPTLAAAAGAALPDGVEIDGRDMLPVATGTGTISHPDDALFWQSGYYHVVRAGNWKLQVDGRQKKSWLFDLANDPTEQTNLVETRADKLAELQGLLDKHHAGAVAPLYPYTIESPVAVDKTAADLVAPGDEYVWWPN